MPPSKHLATYKTDQAIDYLRHLLVKSSKWSSVELTVEARFLNKNSHNGYSQFKLQTPRVDFIEL